MLEPIPSFGFKPAGCGRKLKEYYDTEGQTDPVVIELPKGHYVVTFHAAVSTRAWFDAPPG